MESYSARVTEALDSMYAATRALFMLVADLALGPVNFLTTVSKWRPK